MPRNLQKSRRKAFEQQGGRCFYCGVAIWETSPFELFESKSERSGCRHLQCTAEHLVPRCEGGTGSSENIVAACAHCNHTRHKRKVPPAPKAYREEVRRRVARGRWHNAWVFKHGLLPARHDKPQGDRQLAIQGKRPQQ